MTQVEIKYQGQPGTLKHLFDFSEQMVKAVLTYRVFT
jgi:hypothetical protein